MCGRYSNDRNPANLAAAYGVPGGEDGLLNAWKPTYSIPPTSTAPIVRERLDKDGALERELEPAGWGLRPVWMKDPKKPGFHNARLETVAEKPSFRAAFAARRALVPMNGYYEWVKAEDGGKQPFFIHASDNGLLSAAGLYEVRKDEETDQWQATYTVITTTATDASGEVHDRMPVFLTESAWAEWLRPTKATGDEKTDLLQLLEQAAPQVAATLQTRPVSRRVNNVRTADPRDASLIEQGEPAE